MNETLTLSHFITGQSYDGTMGSHGDAKFRAGRCRQEGGVFERNRRSGLTFRSWAFSLIRYAGAGSHCEYSTIFCWFLTAWKEGDYRDVHLSLALRLAGGWYGEVII
jgi:hypothetical protein